MLNFDFHHHNPDVEFGIFNTKFGDEAYADRFSAGIHPDSAARFSDGEYEWLLKVAESPNCVAIGECGLDSRFDDISRQEPVFQQQIELANTVGKPLIIHCVKTFPKLTSMLKKAEVPVVIHGFNKRKSIGLELLELGFGLSFGRSILYDVNLQAFFREVPAGKFFLESDSGGHCIDEIYHMAATLRNLPPDELNWQIEENLRHINIKI